MKTITLSKKSRIEARLSEQQKEHFLRAASIQGRSLSDFVVDAVQKQADAVIHNHEVMQLTERDREVFVASLLNPAKPNAALKKAFQAYTKSKRP